MIATPHATPVLHITTQRRGHPDPIQSNSKEYPTGCFVTFPHLLSGGFHLGPGFHQAPSGLRWDLGCQPKMTEGRFKSIEIHSDPILFVDSATQIILCGMA